MQRLAMRALLIPVYGLAGLGPAGAYLHFVVGAIAGFDGITKGRYFLGPVLSLLCLLAAFALWRVWLIGGRIWRYGAYMNASPKNRRYDAAGLAAVIGRNANAERGARAAAIVVGFVLARLAIHVSDTPTAPHIGWVESLMAGVLIVLGAAWLGYVGGKRGVGWSQRWFGRTSSLGFEGRSP